MTTIRTIWALWTGAYVLAKSRWRELTMIIIGTFVLIAILMVGYYLIQRHTLGLITSITSFSLYRGITYGAGLLVSFALSALAQTLILSVLVHRTDTFTHILRSLPARWPRFFLWTILFSVGLSIASAPMLIGALLVFVTFAPLAILCIAIGILMTILFAAYSFATPFILIDTKTSVRKAFAASIAAAHAQMEFLILALIAGMLFLTIASLVLETVSMLTGIVGFVIYFVILSVAVSLLFSYLTTLYRALIRSHA